MSGDISEVKTVLIVDDDPLLRRTVGRHLRSEGYQVEEFGSGPEILEATFPEGPSCILLDVKMPGMDGIEVQERLSEREWCPPIVFFSGHSDVPGVEKAMRNNAVGFLKKDCDSELLFQRVEEAFLRSSRYLTELSIKNKKIALFNKLTPREKDVVRLLARGLSSKEIAYELDISEVTVFKHEILSKVVFERMNASFVDPDQAAASFNTPSTNGTPSMTMAMS